MRTLFFFCFLMLSLLAIQTAQASSLFPPEGAGDGTTCPQGTPILTWTGSGIKCTSLSEALKLPACAEKQAIKFDGTKFSCIDITTGGEETEVDPNAIPAGYCLMKNQYLAENNMSFPLTQIAPEKLPNGKYIIRAGAVYRTSCSSCADQFMATCVQGQWVKTPIANDCQCGGG